MPYTVPDDQATTLDESPGYIAPNKPADDASIQQSLLLDPTYSPLDAAHGKDPTDPEFERAFQVHQARSALPRDRQVQLGFAPSRLDQLSAVPGQIAKFAIGLPASPVLNAASVVANAPTLFQKLSSYAGDGAGDAGLVSTPTEDNSDPHPGPMAKSLQTSAVKAEQGALQPIYNIGKRLMHWMGEGDDNADERLDDAAREGPDALKQEEQDQTQKQQDYQRQLFAQSVQDNAVQKSLAQGNVSDEGVYADAAGALGFKPSEVTMTPEEEKAQGVEPGAIRSYATDAASTVQDPTNIAYALAPEVPGVGALLKGTGRLAGRAVQPLANLAEHLPPTTIGRAIHAPVRSLATGLGRTILRAAPSAADFVESAGDLASGAAPEEGASAFGLRAKRALAGTIGGAAIGAGASELQDQDPVAGAISGGGFGLAGGALSGVRPIQEAGVAKSSAEHGASLRTGNDAVDAKHDEIISQYSPDVQDKINRMRSAVSGDGTNLVLTDQSGFNDALTANSTPSADGARGVYLPDDQHLIQSNPDGTSTIYLNTDTIGGYSGDGPIDTAGHEIGHSVLDYLQKNSADGAADALRQAVQNNLTPEELQTIGQNYSRAISGNTDGKIASGQPIDENIAEITRKVLQGEDVSNFALPKPITEKIKDTIASFFGAQRGDSEGMQWGTKEINSAKSKIRDALYAQGQRAAQVRARARGVADGSVAPNVQERQAQIASRLNEISGLRGAQVTPPILAERQGLIEEAATLTQRENARRGIVEPPAPDDQQPAGAPEAPTPPQPAPQPTGIDPRRTVEATLTSLGYSRTVARQTAAVAEGNSEEEMTKDALARLVRPSITRPTDLSNFTQSESKPPAQLENFTPQQENKPAPLENFGQDEPISGKPTDEEASSGGVAVASEPTPASPETSGSPEKTPALPTPESVQAAMGAATEAVQETPEWQRAVKKGNQAKLDTLTKDAHREAIENLLPSVNEGDQRPKSGLYRYTNAQGETDVRGNVNPSNPAEKALLDLGGMKPEDVAKLQDLQSGSGVRYIDYGSAAELPGEHSKTQRDIEQAASSAEDRVKGVGDITKQKNKAVIPIGNKVTNDHRVNSVVYSPDKILSNANAVIAEAKNQEHATGGYENANDPQFLRDLQTYLENHKNGYSGNGLTKLSDANPDAVGNPFRDATGSPVDPQTAQERQDVINMALHDTRSTAKENAEAAREKYQSALADWQKGGKKGPKPRQPRAPKASTLAASQEALALSAFGEGHLGEGGETNALRENLKDGGFDSSKVLETPIENLRPELVRQIRNSPNGAQEIVRPHGVEPEDIAKNVKGTPNSKFTAAGFLPNDQSDPFYKSLQKRDEGDLASFQPSNEQDDLGFYSHLANVIADKIPNKAKPEQILATLKGAGVKQDEMDNMGLQEFLKSHDGPVSKQELSDFVKAGGVQMQEVTKGGSRSLISQDELDRLQGYKDDVSDGGELTDYEQADHDALSEKKDQSDDAGEESNTKFSQYQLPGGTNYKEVLLTLPNTDARDLRIKYEARQVDGDWVVGVKHPNGEFQAQTNWQGDESKARSIADRENAKEQPSDYRGTNIFKSSHWDELNVLAHIRQADHTDIEGNKVRLIEEIQSDWHQKGRKEGYSSQGLTAHQIDVAGDSYKWSVKDRNGNEVATTRADTPDQAIRNVNLQKAPDAPFKKTWQELAFKRALRMAVEDGMDKIAWTPGEQQSARYDLSKQISGIEYKKTDDGKYAIHAFDPNGKQALSQISTESELPNLIGKEMAQKIVNGEGKDAHGNKRLEGLDLKVGGEGMKGFYDKILPAFVSKYVKKWGGKVEPLSIGGTGKIEKRGSSWQVTLGDGHRQKFSNEFSAQEYLKRFDTGIHDVHSVTITPEMRDGVLGGQAMFNPGSENADSKLLQSLKGRDPNPRKTWFIRDGQRIYHNRHPLNGQFVSTNQTLANFQPDDKEEEKSKLQLANF